MPTGRVRGLPHAEGVVPRIQQVATASGTSSGTATFARPLSLGSVVLGQIGTNSTTSGSPSYALGVYWHLLYSGASSGQSNAYSVYLGLVTVAGLLSIPCTWADRGTGLFVEMRDAAGVAIGRTLGTGAATTVTVQPFPTRLNRGLVFATLQSRRAITVTPVGFSRVASAQVTNYTYAWLGVRRLSASGLYAVTGGHASGGGVQLGQALLPGMRLAV